MREQRFDPDAIAQQMAVNPQLLEAIQPLVLLGFVVVALFWVVVLALVVRPVRHTL